MTIPIEYRKASNLVDGDEVTMRVEDGVLIIRPIITKNGKQKTKKQST
jgi:antitoxin component of MazEF toxin-antitoxin module